MQIIRSLAVFVLATAAIATPVSSPITIPGLLCEFFNPHHIPIAPPPFFGICSTAFAIRSPVSSPITLDCKSGLVCGPFNPQHISIAPKPFPGICVLDTQPTA
ncbi:hypothetical protein BDK51DRAFT_34554 [Blyttiomyces helicus]|uniref:Uncharacterized protein n=1 Tax=Blyttiomyces helicus TaxID=388810 RepID=A0A4P9W795_9FUNG|nr:hypothetical protein BDK51DRAFT_34554 [Blyttiomyces helicus]|eukprot:RKO88224.1 hypothetical protein BDK51DRAFT_34554 [Blyttiomyces helicus]